MVLLRSFSDLICCKVVTFDEKQTGDGDFGVNLELSDKEMEHLNDDEISNIGSSLLYNLKVSGVSDVVAKYYSEAGVTRKGVRVHFQLDDSGLVNVTSVEVAFERTVSVEEQAMTFIRIDVAHMFVKEVL